eukprot:CAMPEP_0171214832 /NCGR_PEP_ID=MMETSP0790-20130122/31360_1 /TAXON_ID=2925 /ORGANISM="Alexandrium catenella, Strain OF101" /LENGTH=182 /DNA_ID=CAMNT_0011680577 /DNA_START=65 /DNA_END=610 /DNA_ORIENTATION=+
MGVPSVAQKRIAKRHAAKDATRAKAGNVRLKKKLKKEANRERLKKRQARERAEKGLDPEVRGRVFKGAELAAAKLLASEDVQMRPTKKKAVPVKPGHGSGTPGARAASRGLPKAERISKKGGRRKRPTWHAFGMGEEAVAAVGGALPCSCPHAQRVGRTAMHTWLVALRSWGWLPPRDLGSA